MSDPAQRLSYKFQRLREAIRQAIESGDLTHKLPGERELARRFGANAKTISKALTDLTSEGLLIRRVGRGTFVSGQENVDRLVGSRRRYLWIASSELPHDVVEPIFELAREQLQELGHQISLEFVDPDRQGELPDRCLDIGRLRELSGLLVFSCVPSRAFLADLFRRHLPVVLCNATSPSIKCDAVTADYSMGVFELTEHLAQLGHEKVHLVLDRQTPWTSAKAQRGYHTAMGRFRLQPLPALHCTTQDLAQVMNKSQKISAIVCAGGELAAGIKDQLQRVGKQIPRDVSLVAMAQPGDTAHHGHDITSYESEVSIVVDWALRLLCEYEAGKSAREVLVPGAFHNRGSAKSTDQLTTPAKPQQQVIL